MFTTALILGFAGSLHCAGMCSPLAFAVTNMSKSVWVNRLIYNLGRILTYGVLGAIVSSIGVALPLEKFQTGLSVGMGVLLIAIAFFGIGKVRFKVLGKLSNQFSRWLKTIFSSQIQRKTKSSTFLLGALNGLLPCGLTFIALTACLISPTLIDGFIFMLLFGMGTLPVMLGFSSFIHFVLIQLKLNFNKTNAIIMILAGGLLIGRVLWQHNHTAVVSENLPDVEECR